MDLAPRDGDALRRHLAVESAGCSVFPALLQGDS